MTLPGLGSFPRSMPHDCVRERAPQCTQRSPKLVFSRLTEVTNTTVPAGTTTDAAEPAGRISLVLLGRFLLGAPFEAGAVGPDAVHDDGDLAHYGDLGLLGSDALYQPGAPRLERRPALGSVQQHVGSFEQICSQQPVAPFRDAAINVRPVICLIHR